MKKSDIRAMKSLELILDGDYKNLCDRCKKLELWHKRMQNHLKACYEVIYLLNQGEYDCVDLSAFLTVLHGVIERKVL